MDRSTRTIVGEVSHIRAQKEGGPRFDAGQTSETLHALENLVLMCGVHHKIIDADENVPQYSVEHLIQIKATHESLARITDSEASLTAETVAALLETVRAAAVPTTRMDFRGRLFNAGGYGGVPGGGGGGGGIIHIVGVTPAGIREKVGLDGKPGELPGGGGSGVMVFSGRLVAEEDMKNGLLVSGFFFANAVELTNGLLYVLGAGWEIYTVAALPQDVRISLAGIIDSGAIVPNTRLALAIVVEGPSGAVAVNDPFDLDISGVMRPIMRQCFGRSLQFRVTQPGVWTFTLRSGDVALPGQLWRSKWRRETPGHYDLPTRRSNVPDGSPATQLGPCS